MLPPMRSTQGGQGGSPRDSPDNAVAAAIAGFDWGGFIGGKNSDGGGGNAMQE